MWSNALIVCKKQRKGGRKAPAVVTGDRCPAAAHLQEGFQEKTVLIESDGRAKFLPLH
jgi:hypothetical protein